MKAKAELESVFTKTHTKKKRSHSFLHHHVTPGARRPCAIGKTAIHKRTGRDDDINPHHFQAQLGC